MREAAVSGIEKEDMLDTLFEEDRILPEQFFQQHPSSPDGERALMSAVLEDAVYTIERGRASAGARGKEGRPREVARAIEWIFSDDVVWPFSFLNVCDALGIEPSGIRKKVLQWIHRNEAEGKRSP